MHKGLSLTIRHVVCHQEDAERLKQIVSKRGGLWLGDKPVPCLNYQGVPLFGRFNIECTYQLDKPVEMELLC